MSLQGLIFDVDGTLVDTEELHRQAFNQAFLEYGLDWKWDVALYAELLTVSGGLDRIAHFIDALDLPAAEKTRLRRLIPPIHREKTQIYGWANLFVVAAPSRWTLEQSFAQVDLVLPALGNPARPLDGTAAARIGGDAPCVGLDQLVALRAARALIRRVGSRV
ncbi:MAG TPA: HAD hydrolase-like protein [Magnetospirillaceae bacterium]|nr:HAD hydrolase-like protein [Magnetospirillaceae bacterium]